ncbi:MAG: hypothetical protein GF353_01795 [Candidatus Lokiarchaeota archaeon]|nr:hypothetical protein [Candidatus Lokiarchaeota archaeon]
MLNKFNAYYIKLDLLDIPGDPPDLFPCGVSPLDSFEMSFNSLSQIVSAFEYNFLNVDKTVEICFIGLISYFEAFCKDQFATLINICPELISDLKKRGHDVMIDASHTVSHKNVFYRILGPLLTEKYNFTTSKQINSNFRALLNLSPFSKEEAKRYDEILNERNLIVHHGGIYTMKYLEQCKTRDDINAYWGSVAIQEWDYFDIALMIVKIVAKIVTSTEKALRNYIETNKINLDDDQRMALKILGSPFTIESTP